MRLVSLLCLAALACTPKTPDDSEPGDDSGDSAPPDSPADSGDSAPGDSGDSTTQDTADTADTGDIVEPPWGEGPLTVRGQVYFFDMETPGIIDWIHDVEGAEVYVFEAPELRVEVSPGDDHAFVIEGIPEGVELTLAVVHPDYFPHLTATLATADYDLDGVTFQAVSRSIATLASALLGVDVNDTSRCQMSTTVSAIGAGDVWAPGEPGATVTTEPNVPIDQGPFYFDTTVIPNPSLIETTTDGGVVIVGAEPGTYLWDAHKDGVTFEQLKLRCVGGWLTNGSPPYGLNVIDEGRGGH